MCELLGRSKQGQSPRDSLATTVIPAVISRGCHRHLLPVLAAAAHFIQSVRVALTLLLLLLIALLFRIADKDSIRRLLLLQAARGGGAPTTLIAGPASRFSISGIAACGTHHTRPIHANMALWADFPAAG